MTTASDSRTEDPKGVPAKGTAKWQSLNSRRESRVLDTTMRVTTPENIAFNYQVTGPFRRVFAYGLDLLISLGGYAVFVIICYLLFAFAILPLTSRFGGGNLVQAIMGILAGFISIGYFIVYWFYGAYFETNWNGQTLGKRAARMRVISTDGSAIDGIQAILRNFFRLLDIMPFAPLGAIFHFDQPLPGIVPTCLFGLVIMMLTKNYQRVGDLVAGTVVITEASKGPPTLAAFTDERVPMLAELIPTSFVVPATMARAVAEYVDQRKYLPFQRATEIASHLAIPLMEKFSIQSDTDHDLFLCAMYYKQFVSAQAVDGFEDSAIVPVGTQITPKTAVVPATEASLAEERLDLQSPGSSSTDSIDIHETAVDPTSSKADDE